MAYRVVYSDTSRNLIRNLHPDLKLIIRTRLKKLAEKPYLGKPLVKKLSGYYSLRAKRYRIVYKVREQYQMIEIHFVGHRRDIYQLLKESI